MIGKAKQIAQDDEMSSVASIMNKTLSQATLEAQHFLPSDTVITRKINRFRQKTFEFKDPASVKEINLDDMNKMTIRGDPFLMYNSIGTNNIMIFSTNANLKVNDVDLRFA